MGTARCASALQESWSTAIFGFGRCSELLVQPCGQQKALVFRSPRAYPMHSDKTVRLLQNGEMKITRVAKVIGLCKKRRRCWASREASAAS